MDYEWDENAAGLTEVVVDTAFEAEFDGFTMAPLLGRGRRPATPANGSTG